MYIDVVVNNKWDFLSGTCIQQIWLVHPMTDSLTFGKDYNCLFKYKRMSKNANV